MAIQLNKCEYEIITYKGSKPFFPRIKKIVLNHYLLFYDRQVLSK